MTVLTLASDPEDATALEGAEAHHARLVGELAGRVKMLLIAADRDPGAAERMRTGPRLALPLRQVRLDHPIVPVVRAAPGAPLLFQLHAISALLLFAAWPFTRLVHMLTAPHQWAT